MRSVRLPRGSAASSLLSSSDFLVLRLVRALAGALGSLKSSSGVDDLGGDFRAAEADRDRLLGAAPLEEGDVLVLEACGEEFSLLEDLPLLDLPILVAEALCASTEPALACVLEAEAIIASATRASAELEAEAISSWVPWAVSAGEGDVPWVPEASRPGLP